MKKNMQKRLTFLAFTLILVMAAMGAASAVDQPDLQIANDTSAPVGNDVYNTDASGQTLTQDVETYNPTIYDLTVQNDGDATDSILVQGTASSDGWTVQYFDDLNNDITSQVTGVGWVVSLAPGASQNFRAEVSAGSSVAIGATKDVLVTAISGNDNTKQDVVKATTRYTAGLLDPNVGGIILGGNDDSTTGAIALPFIFNFYGTNYNNIYINNNGYVFFNNPSGIWWLTIPQAGSPFVSAFVNDILTTYADSGKVHYDANSERAVITWDRVRPYAGYVAYNTFQVILTSGGQIGLSYGDMQWGTGQFLFNQGDGSTYVQVTPTNPDYRTYWFNNFGQPSTPELGITKNPDRNPANYNVGEDVVFTIYTQNVGTGTANNVVITDTIPVGFSVVDADGGTVDGNTITWNIGNLLAGGDNTILLTLRVLDGYQGQTLTNSVSAGCYQTGIVTNTSSIYVNRAALEIFKTTDRNPATYNVGENVVYSITVDNEGPDAATNVVVTDTLPAGLTFVSATNGGVWDANTRTVTWNVGNMDNVDQFTATVTATVTSEAAGKTLENTATVDADQLSNPLTATASIYVPYADLVLTKTVDKATATVKDTVVFTLIVNNNGPDTAVNVTVNDKLPAGLSYVSSVANFGTYDPTTGLWTIDNLPNGASAVLTITSVVEESGQIVNQANVTALTWDPNLDDNAASAAMNVQAEPVPVSGKTVALKKTGAPIFGVLLAFFMVLAGLVLPKRK